MKRTIPQLLQGWKERMEKIKIPSRIIFFTLGIASTLWFLIRVIPKPQRATYPCMRVAAPVMSSFVIYLLSLSGIVLAFRQSKKKLLQAKYLSAAGFLIISALSAYIYFVHDSVPTRAATLPDSPNSPMGTAQGIKPGRVVWAWDPDATDENLSNKFKKGADYDSTRDSAYFNPKFVNQALIDSMISRSLRKLTGEPTDSDAWNAIFKFFNKKKKGAEITYQPNEKIFIKINMTGCSGIVPAGYYYNRIHPDLTRVNPSWMPTPDIVETNPYTVMSLLRQLVNIMKIPQNLIYVGDPMKNVYQDLYDYWKNEFPNVNILGNNIISYVDLNSLGRVPVQHSASDLVFYANGTKDKLYTILQDADYLINLANLKGHIRNGITLCAKLHFGSQTRNTAEHLHTGLLEPDPEKQPSNQGYKKYRVLVDLMGNKYLGGNTLLYIVDGLFSAEEEWNGPNVKWKMYPFNNDYPSSIFMSLDPVAIESVCFDFLRNEYTPENGYKLNYPSIYEGVDDYLHQAADKNNWPDGTNYKPNGDGIEIGSLGVHEHWNNAAEKKYSRNIDPVNGKGIELVGVGKAEQALGMKYEKTEYDLSLKIYPNPASEYVTIKFTVKETAFITVDIFNIKGQKITTLLNKKLSAGEYAENWNLEKITEGSYICNISVLLSDKVIKEFRKIQIIK